MSDLALPEGGYELDDPINFAFGEGTVFRVEQAEFGGPDLRLADADVAMGDGIRFGRDYRGGRVITFTINALKKGPVTDDIGDFEAAWIGDEVRDVPGSVVGLRMRRNGRGRVVYGRPREFAATSLRTTKGWAPITCAFKTIDHLYYSDRLLSQTVGMSPKISGGFRVPTRVPIRLGGSNESNNNVIQVGGNRPTWPVITIRGPIANPEIRLVGVGSYFFNCNLAFDQYLVLDTRPWSRGVHDQNGSNRIGDLSPTAPPLASFQLPPGEWQFVLAGTDPSRTSRLELQWRDAFAAF